METYKLIPNPYPTLVEMLQRIKVGDRVAASIRSSDEAHGYAATSVRQAAVRIGIETGRKFTCNFDRDTFTMYVTRTA